MKLRRPLYIPLPLLVCLLVSSVGCVYYNTFFNARQAFNDAEKYRKSSGVGSSGGYQTAIDKALKVTENYPNSKYYDDALYVLGVSYYYTGQYMKSERRCRELLANYTKSKYVKELTLYLARAKLKLGEEEEAFKLFEEVFQGKYSKEYRAEAALELGQYHREQKDYVEAERYFRAVRDSLGDDKQRMVAQTDLANTYFDGFKFSEALSGYLQMLGMKPSKNERYLALYRSALCSYRLQRIPAGMDYLDKLVKDPLYYDSVSALQLTVGQGHEYSGDLAQAEAVYEEVAATTRNQTRIAEANYRLGLIYQFDYDDLTKAKSYYDKSAEANRGTEAGKDALQRASDIAKMQSLTKTAEEALTAELAAREEKARKDSLREVQAVDSSLTPTPDSTHASVDSIAATRDSVTIVKDTTAAFRDTTNQVAPAESVLTTEGAVMSLPDTIGSAPVNDSAARTRDTITASLDTNSLVVDKDRTSAAGDSLSARVDTSHAIGALPAKDSTKDKTAVSAINMQKAKALADTLAAKKAVQDRIDNAGKTLYQLAELFWFQLEKPDSALNELNFLLQHFPTSASAPRALIALSQMHRDFLADTVGADSLLHALLIQYPHSDLVPQALSQLKLLGTASDTGYASLYFDKAEDFLIDSANVDSALYYYQYVVDHFRESPLYTQARFNVIWVAENYRSPGDSSIVAAYKLFVDSFPGNVYAQEATRKLTYKPPEKKATKQDKDEAKQRGIDTVQAPLVAIPVGTDEPEDSAIVRYTDPLVRVYVGPKDEQLILLDIKPVETAVDFDFPAEGYTIQQNEFILYFQILLDFSAKVIDYKLKVPSESDEINRRALLTVASMTFDPLAVNKELTTKSTDLILPEDKADPRGRWYVFKYIVEKPGHAR